MNPIQYRGIFDVELALYSLNMLCFLFNLLAFIPLSINGLIINLLLIVLAIFGERAAQILIILSKEEELSFSKSLADKNQEILMRVFFLDAYLHIRDKNILRSSNDDQIAAQLKRRKIALHIQSVFACFNSCACLFFESHGMILEDKSEVILSFCFALHLISLSVSHTTVYLSDQWELRKFKFLAVKNVCNVLSFFGFWSLCSDLARPLFIVSHIVAGIIFLILIYFLYRQQSTVENNNTSKPKSQINQNFFASPAKHKTPTNPPMSEQRNFLLNPLNINALDGQKEEEMMNIETVNKRSVNHLNQEKYLNNHENHIINNISNQCSSNHLKKKDIEIIENDSRLSKKELPKTGGGNTYANNLNNLGDSCLNPPVHAHDIDPTIISVDGISQVKYMQARSDVNSQIENFSDLQTIKKQEEREQMKIIDLNEEDQNESGGGVDNEQNSEKMKNMQEKSPQNDYLQREREEMIATQHNKENEQEENISANEISMPVKFEQKKRNSKFQLEGVSLPIQKDEDKKMIASYGKQQVNQIILDESLVPEHTNKQQYFSEKVEEEFLLLLKFIVCGLFLNTNYMEDIYFSNKEHLTKPLCSFKAMNIIFLFIFDTAFSDFDSFTGLRILSIIAGIIYLILEIALLTEFNWKNTLCYEFFVKEIEKRKNKQRA